MDLTHLKKHQSYIIVALLLVFMGITFILRIIPAAFIKDAGFLYIFDTDSWYTMRQVEVMVRHFPQYNWFDPMTAYPTGKIIDWGPLFAGIAAVVCLIDRCHDTQRDYFYLGLGIPPHSRDHGAGSISAGKNTMEPENRNYRCRSHFCRFNPVFFSFLLWMDRSSHRRSPFQFAFFSCL